ncbi:MULTISPECIES: hypothetical protein [unclassified Variovorax]|uniref:hypothetical protein n=1 Tax=unclassified Variovorax TaxID=663243 RepID=UPI00076D7334|nr:MULTISPECIES: hypothetical protein [unclassified Variovorax]KWT98330.1 hypothetical protein APY03_0465 [Variovorax sp. WDL1]PNG50014.1 hypothetical protein CHC06_05595 [Variovorax sp. B2]PNG50886.1 hypothetical protein CHC07_05500 [Variovorax sp. B4]VTU41470.1 hypothetical protein SRS16P1_00008 [Variovorax sp. SRS16]VTU41499.1 hypothetical protein E5P1_00008 [Variovorax sp. PBL-E5]
MIHDLFIVGEIRKITVSTPKDPKKGASAVLMVQWGPVREQSGGVVDFINAGQVRIPNYRFPKLQDRLKVGQTVKINGHIQGVVKTLDADQFLSNELVADRVFILDEPSTPAEAAAAAAE